MKRAVLFGIFACGLTATFAIACAPTYGDAQGEQPSADEIESTKADKSATLPAGDAAAPKGHVTGGNASSGDASTAPPKTPGSALDPDASAASSLDGGSCARAPSPSGYIVHEPTPQAIGACSNGDIGYYEGLLAVKDQTFGAIKKALSDRNDLCAACVFSKYADETWSPVVMLDKDQGFYNWGSCYANSPGGTPECAQQAQQYFSCLDDACGDCVSDDDYNACVDKAASDKSQCGGLKFDKCNNLDALNAACDSISKAITVACGP